MKSIKNADNFSKRFEICKKCFDENLLMYLVWSGLGYLEKFTAEKLVFGCQHRLRYTRDYSPYKLVGENL